MIRSIILSLLFLLGIQLSSFGSNFENTSNPDEGIKAESTLKKLVDKHVIYPIFQNENMEGTAEVSFKINTEGQVNILNHICPRRF